MPAPRRPHNPPALFLEEIIRAIAEGKPPTRAETVLAMLQAELIEQQRQSQFSDDIEYGFRHGRVRDAA